MEHWPTQCLIRVIEISYDARNHCSKIQGYECQLISISMQLSCGFVPTPDLQKLSNYFTVAYELRFTCSHWVPSILPSGPPCRTAQFARRCLVTRSYQHPASRAAHNFSYQARQAQDTVFVVVPLVLNGSTSLGLSA